MPQPTPNQLAGIFICYRREDSSGHAGRLFDKLADHFGKDRIFMDIEMIEPGEDFVTAIENIVGSCEILIAIIGRHWLSAGSETSRLLDNPDDFVRLEISTALNRDVSIVPVLVQGAIMPKPQDLPASMMRLSRRNAFELSDLRWRLDVDRLIRVFEKILSDREELRRRAAQENEERKRQAAEEERRKAEAEAEANRRQEDEKRKQEVVRAAEQERQLQEAEVRRLAEEHRQEEEEAAKRKLEEETRVVEEARQLLNQAEARRLAEEARLRKEEAAKRKLETEARLAEEAPKLLEQAEAHRLATEKERKLDVPMSLNPNPPAALPIPTISAGEKSRESRGTRHVIRLVGAILLAGAAVLVVWVAIQKGIRERYLSGSGVSLNHPSRVSQTATALPSPSPQTPSQLIFQPPPGMVFVEGGEFWMGRDDKDATPYERPAHLVRVNAFFIDIYEVTNTDYRKFIKATGHPAPIGWPSDWIESSIPTKMARKPVTGVKWGDAVAYATWANKRLPTEEEWEFAARGKDGRVYPWGNEWQEGLANANWIFKGMADVGHFTGKSPDGLYDMAGNAWEWTSSSMRAYTEKQLPVLSSDTRKVIRGGTWDSKVNYVTTTYRKAYRTSGASDYSKLGFRCAKDLPGS